MSPRPPADEPGPPERPTAIAGGGEQRRFVARNQHERIQVATARAIAAHGYEETTLADICAEAQISEQVFREHFKDKQEAALSALEATADHAMKDIRETFKATPTWPDAVWASSEAMLEWMVHDPAMAHLALVGLMAAGEQGFELLQSLMDAFAMFLEPGYELLPDGTARKALTDEAVANAIFALLHEHIAAKGTAQIMQVLPEMVRAILTPFLGAERAGAFVARRSAESAR